MGTKGCAAPCGACIFICVQGCHTAAKLRRRQSSFKPMGGNGRRATESMRRQESGLENEVS